MTNARTLNSETFSRVCNGAEPASTVLRDIAARERVNVELVTMLVRPALVELWQRDLLDAEVM
jgi:hypothetical protein